MNTGGDSGFTLLELLVTVALAAILLAIGVPSFLDTVRNNRMAAASNDLLAAMHLARSEAVKRRVAVTVCSSADPLAAAPACSGGTLNGWVAFVDDNENNFADASDGNNAIDGGEDVLNAHAALTGGIQTFSDGSYVSFAGTGFPRDAGGAPAATVIRLCDERGNVNAGGGTSTARALRISTTGRPQVLRTMPDVTAAGDCP